MLLRSPRGSVGAKILETGGPQSGEMGQSGWLFLELMASPKKAGEGPSLV